MKKPALLALVLTVAPIALQAETVTGGLTLSYTKQDTGGPDMKTTGVDGRMKVDFENGFTFGITAGKSKTSQSGSPVELDGEFFSLEGGYRFSNGIKVGAFADRLTIGVNLLPIDLSLKTNGLSLGYEGNGYEVEAFVGDTTLSPLVLPFDVRNVGLTASYTGTPGLEVGGAFLRAELSDGSASENIDFKGVAATYVFKDSFMVFGGIAKSDFFDTLALDTTGIGVGYDLGPATGFSSTLSLELARTDSGGSSDIDTVRIGLTVPFGKKGPMLPMNSVADSILNPRHGAFNAAITAAF